MSRFTKHTAPCSWFEPSQHPETEATVCFQCGWIRRLHPPADPARIEKEIAFYPTFPQRQVVRDYVRRRLPRGNRITEAATLSVLRHTFTNYDELLRHHRWEHDVLKAEVNRLMLERIGEGWKPLNERKEWADECAYDVPCKKCIHPRCKNYT